MGCSTLSLIVLIYVYGILDGACRSPNQDAHVSVERLANERTVHLMLSDPVAHRHTQHPKICMCDASLGNWIKQPQLIRNAGYPAEIHNAVTTDGYILQLHRIPSGRKVKGSSSSKKKAVLIIHGLLGGSSNFVIMGPERSLGYILADAGYDVWLGNLRGTLSTGHKRLTRDNPKFWDFSFHENGKYDVPALIDKVLSVTGLPKLLYIGHSMGTTSFFIAISLRPEYNKKVVAFVALAPAVYVDNMRPLAETAIKRLNIIDVMRSTGFISASIPPEVLNPMVAILCSVKPNRDNFCVQLLQILAGEDMEQIDSV